jgi:hypothetical protein
MGAPSSKCKSRNPAALPVRARGQEYDRARCAALVSLDAIAARADNEGIARLGAPVFGMEGWRDANQAPLLSGFAASDGGLLPSDFTGLTAVRALELVGEAFVRGRARIGNRARLFSLVVAIVSHGMAQEGHILARLPKLENPPAASDLASSCHWCDRRGGLMGDNNTHAARAASRYNLSVELVRQSVDQACA